MNTFLSLALLTLTSGAQPEPLQSREAIVDRGEVKAGMPLVQKFALTNSGQTAIGITELNAGCGCVRPRVSKKSLQPGESTELEVEVNTLSQNVGPNVWKLDVRYQHGPEGQRMFSSLELKIQGKIVREIAVEPVSLFLSIEREATHIVTVTDRRIKPIKPLTITSARCESKHVKLDLTATGANRLGQQIQQVHVTVLETCPPGHFMENLLLLTDDPEYRELRVPLMVTRRAPGQAVATPEQIDLRLAKGQNTASGLVRMRTPDDTPVIVERIEADNPAVRFKWAAGPGSMATLRLGVELDSERKPGLATVKVWLKEPKAQVIVIPLSWQVP